MKVINVIGHSCTGKTTFIAQLVGRLGETGRVATIKHLGHHPFTLAPGKDTTIFYESGAGVSAGIDDEKSVLILRDLDLAGVLDIFADMGFDYTVIEGFKSMGLPAIVMGELKEGWILFRNPTIEQVIQEIETFPAYHTIKSLEQWIEKSKCVSAAPELILSQCREGKAATNYPAQNEKDSSGSSSVVKVSCSAGIRTTPGSCPLKYENLDGIAESVSTEINASFNDMRIGIDFQELAGVFRPSKSVHCCDHQEKRKRIICDCVCP